eukprot:CAMPEP_0182900668 /NCGR_PEP_ID=MMETSP0034_2-20130328/29015_1 /TAXON_ID=156128 /ORGANISM="Nephroselmis pyriformis, Strain CCMP717" /LENGTH=196 /DNA_ID=CAMNT_0025034919 /DNA_START=102 /DNA_END=688 /DNA_ORIENTATION=-
MTTWTMLALPGLCEVPTWRNSYQWASKICAFLASLFTMGCLTSALYPIISFVIIQATRLSSLAWPTNFNDTGLAGAAAASTSTTSKAPLRRWALTTSVGTAAFFALIWACCRDAGQLCGPLGDPIAHAASSVLGQCSMFGSFNTATALLHSEGSLITASPSGGTSTSKAYYSEVCSASNCDPAHREIKSALPALLP